MISDLKLRIYKLQLSRQVIAQRLGMTYTTLNNKLGGFSRFTDQQERDLLRILDDAEQAQASLESDRTEKETAFYAR